MECLHKLYRKVKGKEYMLPCGQCIACRLNRAREWSIRIMHELRMHNGVGCFITLTYNQQFVPWVSDFRATLVKEDVQKFIKRLRKRLDGVKIRYFLCGEYGEEKFRPHFHICLFGWRPSDLVFYKKSNGVCLYTSKFLDDVWSTEVDVGEGLKKRFNIGFVTVGDITYDSANYVARYCTKVLTGKEKVWYKDNNIIPEFSLMSRRPGIGASWLEKYGSEVKVHHNVVVKGKEVSPPRYYKNKVYDEVDRCVDRSLAADFIIKKAKQLAEDLKCGCLAQDRLSTREKTILARMKKRSG